MIPSKNTKPALPGDLRWKATELPAWQFSSDEGIEPQSYAATGNSIDQEKDGHNDDFNIFKFSHHTSCKAILVVFCPPRVYK